ncbi:precorrin-6y C5,15-methyltransferase (decarboxylating) subunit CbiE [Alicyclobacillus fastidiosus]|uniref:Precorrin-6y C5,15-methyltransferase (Decarboxylating) subunit CbiE n=1 Tax=Alicyclobacillus fastidiosus TaxID=392011 RepID=A0ABY6ZFP7_9BACL|nr:precorrin-6y C5,15-methyltransferase (decarboxylating) subunit CbiE [Alicyclobacillus fastidiosus]WAH41745.1 precorrin-6y C5,15-methyltransferase (decarboxylating) subunit CbiE [Alicyclobacillus fastidiosus]GMA63434.1 precorrin-6Y C5,15-methyltransferase [Alicyclobacillus fastidiosus]
MTDKRVVVIGVGDDGVRGLSTEVRAVLSSRDVLYGSDRQLSFFPDFPGEKRVFTSPLQAVIEDIKREADKRLVAVLASGDPLFYGIGSTLVKRLGSEQVHIYPHLSSIQLAFARAGLGWQDARIISLHGRDIAGFAQRLHGAALAAVLTDEVNTPGAIANYLLAYQMTEYDAFVAEHLCGDEERTGWYALGELRERSFAPLNVLILHRRPDACAPAFTLGMEDSEFSQRKPDRGLITKREVRVQSLAELRLNKGDVLWDIGACTGSVSIEAILSTPELRVFAVEKNEGDLINLRENQVKFRTDFVAIHAKAPAGLDAFPDPDAVFIGGSGGELGELLRNCASRLREGGRIVVNAATIENLYEAHQTLGALGFNVSVTLIQSARSKPILNLTRFEGMNPVYLVTGWRMDAKEDGHSGD